MHQETAQEELALRPKASRSIQNAIPVQSTDVFDELRDIADPLELEPHVLRAVHAEEYKQVFRAETQDVLVAEASRYGTAPQLVVVERKREMWRLQGCLEIDGGQTNVSVFLNKFEGRTS